MADICMLISWKLFLTPLYFLKEKMNNNKIKHNLFLKFSIFQKLLL